MQCLRELTIGGSLVPFISLHVAFCSSPVGIKTLNITFIQPNVDYRWQVPAFESLKFSLLSSLESRDGKLQEALFLLLFPNRMSELTYAYFD